ncbi:MAG: HD domain-containing protein, partial [Firmicutes bacterium]|nr:HD domain-containing protein [Bacillota bacterium]
MAASYRKGSILLYVKQLVLPVQNLNTLMDEISPSSLQHNTNKYNIKIITTLLQTLKIHHFSTYQHSLNVARLSAWLARKIGLPQSEIFEIALGALIHDIGKIKIDTSILDKPGKLTHEEWQTIKKHPQMGLALVAGYNWARSLYPMIAYHHERIDS